MEWQSGPKIQDLQLYPPGSKGVNKPKLLAMDGWTMTRGSLSEVAGLTLCFCR